MLLDYPCQVHAYTQRVDHVGSLVHATHWIARADATRRTRLQWWGAQHHVAEPPGILRVRYKVLGPPWCMAACAWLAERYSGSHWDTMMTTWDAAYPTLIDHLAIPPHHQHHAHFVVTSFRALWEHPITLTTPPSPAAPDVATSPR